jgi:hypothetical protein
MQERLRTKKIGYKKEFLREIIKEVRVKGSEISLTYRIPLAPKNPSGEGRGGEFFTVLQNGGRSRIRTYDLSHVRRIHTKTTTYTLPRNPSISTRAIRPPPRACSHLSAIGHGQKADSDRDESGWSSCYQFLRKAQGRVFWYGLPTKPSKCSSSQNLQSFLPARRVDRRRMSNG